MPGTEIVKKSSQRASKRAISPIALLSQKLYSRKLQPNLLRLEEQPEQWLERMLEFQNQKG
jgi:hypothetical protein